VARLSLLAGRVSFQPSGSNDWSDATLNYAVTEGDRLFAGETSRAELEVGAIAVRLAANTDVTTTDLDDQVLQLGVAAGTIRISVRELLPGDSIEVDTPNGVLNLLDVGTYRIDIDSADSTTVLVVDNGSAQVSGGGVTQVIGSGAAVELSGTDPLQVAAVERPAGDAFDTWSAERDRHVTSSASTQYVSSEVPGYDELDDAGRWQVQADYGPVWYPRVAVGWVPYRFGHWVWVDPWGWTWVEDEPWGYAPFHYGRWVFVGSTWGWLPGPIVRRPCYAPALVTFVVVRRAGVQAWFPLGPREPYFPWYHHSERYARDVNATNLRNAGDLGPRTHVTDSRAIPHVNRRVATTAVLTTTFQTGQMIGRRVVPLTPTQLARSEITPHPAAPPAPSAAAGGRPVPPPTGERPLFTRPPAERFPTAAGATPAAPTGGGAPLRPARRFLTPSAPAPSAAVPPAPAAVPAAPAAPGHVGEPRRALPPLIVRHPPPPPTPPFPAREQAMQAHPGRPLEPQQIESLRAGRPVPPMRDPEFPVHPAPLPRMAPSPSPKPATRPATKPHR
jgi:hypothetical protein